VRQVATRPRESYFAVQSPSDWLDLAKTLLSVKAGSWSPASAHAALSKKKKQSMSDRGVAEFTATTIAAPLEFGKILPAVEETS
jgi:hypothetical protein